MARIRTIKPGFWKHEDLSALPPETHMLAAALLNYADDYGYFNANEKLIKAECCPLRDDSVNVHGMILQLAQIGYIRLGKGSDGKDYGHIITFNIHQKVNRANESKIKKLKIVWNSLNDHGSITDQSRQEGKGKEVNGSAVAAPEDLVWTTGVGLGIARSLLGKLCKTHGTEKVAAAVIETDRIKPADPKSYLISLLSESDPLATAI